MSQKLIQCFIRGDILSIELVEYDTLGRAIGGIVVVDAPVSPALRAAIDTQVQEAITAQDQTISDAVVAKQANPDAEVRLVAKLTENTAVVADVQEVAHVE